MLDGFQLHLVGISPLTWQQALTLKVAVYHDDYGGIIIQTADDNRHCLFLGQLTGPVAAVSGDNLITALWTGAGNRGNQNAILPDAVRCLHHGIIIFHLKGMILEWVQLRQRNLNNFLAACVSAAFLGSGFAFRHSLITS